MNLKVAVIEPVGGHGGMDYYDFGLCGGLAEAGVDVVLHTCNETSIPGSVGFAVRYSYSKIFGKEAAWRRGLRFIFGSALAVLSAIREGRSIVHLHFFHVSTLTLMNLLLARIAGRKVVITAHDVESFVSSLEVPFMSRMAYRLAHQIIAHNQISRGELRARLHVAEDKITVIPHGNYLHALRTMPTKYTAREKLGIPLQAKVLLFFGQIKEVKGLDVLLDAMPVVLQRHPDTVLLIAGKTWKEDFTVYQARMEALGIRKACVMHIRYIHDEDVPLYYGAADLVVLPYRRIYQSGVLLMAMSYCKAVLVSDIPGMMEVVRERDTGFVFKSGDVADLAKKLIKILSDATNRETVALRGRKLVEKKYDWARIGLLTKDLYASLAK